MPASSSRLTSCPRAVTVIGESGRPICSEILAKTAGGCSSSALFQRISSFFALLLRHLDGIQYMLERYFGFVGFETSQ